MGPMSPRGPRHPALAAVLAVLLLALAPPRAADNDLNSGSSTWKFNPCLELNGIITAITENGPAAITGSVVPSSADKVSVCGFCEESDPYLMLRWSNDKYLVFFIALEDGLMKTFRLDQVQYVEGTKLWYSNIVGIRGAIDGRVSCGHDFVIPLKFDEEAEEFYHCESSGQVFRRSIATRTSGGGRGNESVLESSSPSDVRSSNGDGNQRSIKLENFNVMYAENINNAPSYETSCQREPDLTITLAVAGVLSAAVLIGLSVGATRLFL